MRQQQHRNVARRGVLTMLLSVALGLNAFACGGDNDSGVVPCKRAAAECLSAQIGQICDGQGRWATFQCASDQACVGGACVPNAAVSTGSCQLASQCNPGQECRDGQCVSTSTSTSTCTSNERKCVTSTLLQVCPADGVNPTSTLCPTGSVCQSGECVGSCVPNTRSCSASHVARECRADGSGYIELPCIDGRYCEEGRCVGDPYGECHSGDAVCKDLSTVLVCKKDGSGYESKPCAQGTFCEDGQCWGPVCAAGTSECLSSEISTSPGMFVCDDAGASYTVKFCQGKEVCLRDYYSVYGQCYAPPCSLGDVVCGNPEKPEVPMPHRLSRCETLSDTTRGWVAFECDAPAVCKEIDGRARCVSPCVPGEQRCGDNLHGIDICDQNGNWVPTPCNTDGGSLVCVKVPLNGNVACGDPLCKELQTNSTTYKIYGVCEGKQIKRCGEDGKLRPPVDCEYGECVYNNSSRWDFCEGAR